MYCDSIDGILMTVLTRTMINISPLLFLSFWVPVCYKMEDDSFPSDSSEGCGHFVGIAESVGLMDNTQKVIYYLLV